MQPRFYYGLKRLQPHSAGLEVDREAACEDPPNVHEVLSQDTEHGFLVSQTMSLPALNRIQHVADQTGAEQRKHRPDRSVSR